MATLSAAQRIILVQMDAGHVLQRVDYGFEISEYRWKDASLTRLSSRTIQALVDHGYITQYLARSDEGVYDYRLTATGRAALRHVLGEAHDVG